MSNEEKAYLEFKLTYKVFLKYGSKFVNTKYNWWLTKVASYAAIGMLRCGDHFPPVKRSKAYIEGLKQIMAEGVENVWKRLYDENGNLIHGAQLTPNVTLA